MRMQQQLIQKRCHFINPFFQPNYTVWDCFIDRKVNTTVEIKNSAGSQIWSRPKCVYPFTKMTLPSGPSSVLKSSYS